MENSTNNNLRPVLIFLALTFALSSIFYYLIIDAGSLSANNGLYVIGVMWCPGIAALITMKILKRSWKELGWKWGKTSYQLKSYVIPILYALVAYVIVWVLGLGGFYDEEFVARIPEMIGFGPKEPIFSVPLFILVIGTIGFLVSALYALGEEIGWRGFLTPELYKSQGFTKTSIIVGLIWGIWHAPILLFADYNSGTPAWYGMTCFLLLTTSISFIYTWFRMKSGSLWTAVILHATHNLYIQGFFTPLTVDTGNTAYYIDEFGIVLPLVAVGFAVYYWTRRKELEPEVLMN